MLNRRILYVSVFAMLVAVLIIGTFSGLAAWCNALLQLFGWTVLGAAIVLSLVASQPLRNTAWGFTAFAGMWAMLAFAEPFEHFPGPPNWMNPAVEYAYATVVPSNPPPLPGIPSTNNNQRTWQTRQTMAKWLQSQDRYRQYQEQRKNAIVMTQRTANTLAMLAVGSFGAWFSRRLADKRRR